MYLSVTERILTSSTVVTAKTLASTWCWDTRICMQPQFTLATLLGLRVSLLHGDIIRGSHVMKLVIRSLLRIFDPSKGEIGENHALLMYK